MLLNREKSHHFNNSNTGSCVSIIPIVRQSNVRLGSITNLSVIERSIVLDWQNFIVSSIIGVRLGSIAELFDWIGREYFTLGHKCSTKGPHYKIRELTCTRVPNRVFRIQDSKEIWERDPGNRHFKAPRSGISCGEKFKISATFAVGNADRNNRRFKLSILHHADSCLL